MEIKRCLKIRLYPPKKLKKKYPDIASKYTTAIEDNVMLELGYLKVYRTGQTIWKRIYPLNNNVL